jgi:hypothetical protein
MPVTITTVSQGEREAWPVGNIWQVVLAAEWTENGQGDDPDLREEIWLALLDRYSS